MNRNRIAAVTFFALLAAHASGQTRGIPSEIRCKGNPNVIGACFKVRGRLSSWNGNPTFRIWPVGTKRIIGVREEFDLPPELNNVLGHFDDEVFAEFEVCPLTKDKPGTMQIVCVESATAIRKQVRKRD